MIWHRLAALPLALLVLPSPLAQDQSSSPPPNAVILYDPGPEITCIANVTATDCAPVSTTPIPLHQQIYLHVLNSLLLTRYVLHWGGERAFPDSFPILAGGPVQALVLDMPESAATKPDQVLPATKWTANTILESLLDPGNSVSPELDLDRQHTALTKRQAEVQSRIDAFNNLYRSVVGGPDASISCDPVTPRSGYSLAQCLNTWYKAPFPLMNRQVSLTLDSEWRRHFQDVQTFAREFNDNHIGARALELESDIRFYTEEADVFHANVLACKDTYSLVMDMRNNREHSAVALAALLQVRARLAAEAGVSASAPTSMLDREVLADAEIEALIHLDKSGRPDSLSGKHLETLHESCKNLDAVPNPFADALISLKDQESYLPSLVKSINDTMAMSVAKLNCLYETAKVGPIDTLYNTNFGPTEKSVSYSIGAIHQFTPYSLVGALPAEGAPGSSGPTTHEVIVASGAFTIPAPASSGPTRRNHFLTRLFIRIF